MILSEKKKFIFIHIYKTAGTSIRSHFIPFGRWRERFIYQYKPTSYLFWKTNGLLKLDKEGPRKFVGFNTHATAFEISDKLGKETYENYYSFAFVRNPFDWMVSLYFYIKESPFHKHYKIVNQMNFEQFVRHRIKNNQPTFSNFVDDLNRNCLVNFIGKFETLEEDMETICKQLDIPFSGLPKKNISLGKKKNFREYHTRKTKEMIANHFYADLKRFGYQF